MRQPPKFEDLSESWPEGYPHKKQFDANRFAYVTPLTFGRGRINVTTMQNRLGIEQFY